MLSIALTLTAIVLFNSVISLIGHGAITETLYNFVFTYLLPSDLHRKQNALKKEILAGRRELHNTSAQDEFSKWAKIRRRVDKQTAELEATASSLNTHRSSFSKYTKVLLFILTTGLQWTYSTRYSKQPIVYLPQGWFGSPLTWILGLPFAPKGALSCGIWIMLLKRVTGTVLRIGKEVVLGLRGEETKTDPVAVPVAAEQQRTQPKAIAAKKQQ